MDGDIPQSCRGTDFPTADCARIDELNREGITLLVDSPRRAAEHLRATAEQARKCNYPAGEIRAVMNLGAALGTLGHSSEAKSKVEQALAMAQEIGDRDIESEALCCLAYEHKRSGNFRDAILLVHRSLSLSRELHKPESTAIVLTRLGLLYSHLGDLPQALELLQQAHDISLDVEDKLGVATSLTNMAVIYGRMQQSETALEYMRTCLALFNEVGKQQGASVTRLNMAIVYTGQGRFSEARELLLECLAFAQAAGQAEHETQVLINLGQVHLQPGEYRQARDRFEQALERARSYGDRYNEMHALSGIGSAYCAEGDTHKGLTTLLQAAELGVARGYHSELPTLFMEIAAAYGKLGDYRAALAYSQRLREAERELCNEQTDEKLRNLTILHETETARREAELTRRKNLELVETNRHLEQLVRSRNEMLGIAAHDLKNPIANILDIARFVERKLGEVSRAEVRTMIGDISGISRRMVTIVNDLLHTNRMEQDKYATPAHLYLHRTAQDVPVLAEESAEPEDIAPAYAQKAHTAAACAERSTNALHTEYEARDELKYALPAVYNGSHKGSTKNGLDDLYRKVEQALRRDDKQELPGLYESIMHAHEKAGNIEAALDCSLRLRKVERELFEKQSGEKLRKLRILHATESARKEAEINRRKNEELAEANRHLEQLVRSRNELLGIAAHDLKNPLANIIDLTRLAESDKRRQSDEAVREYVADIAGIARRMLGIVSGLLDINRIDQGQLSVHPSLFCLHETTGRFLSLYAEAAHKKNICLAFGAENAAVTAYADRDITIQIIDNLMSNAVKFSPRNATVWVQVYEYRDADGAGARLEVQDEGPGVPDKEIARLFTKFAKLSPRPTAGESSTGLGLAIVKQLVQAMQGRVWYERRAGKGATFVVELPQKAAPVADSPHDMQR